MAPISTLMTKELITVHPDDSLDVIQNKFKENNIHHLPVIDTAGKLEGIISKSDVGYFLRGFTQLIEDEMVNATRSRTFKAKDIMTTGIAKLSPTDRLNVTFEIFNENLFHAIPIVDDHDQLLGIITTFDILHELSKIEVFSEDIIKANKDYNP